ncbi:MAG TPA: hypothetical protein PL005_08600 [Candidatus Hydrogenedentes bacterium]|nr:hypothetical protein [Candidatus Hydrogenedentota bacterium]
MTDMSPMLRERLKTVGAAVTAAACVPAAFVCMALGVSAGWVAALPLLAALELRGWRTWTGRWVLGALALALAAGLLSDNMVAAFACVALLHLFLLAALLSLRPGVKRLLTGAACALPFVAVAVLTVAGDVSPREEVGLFYGWLGLAAALWALSFAGQKKNPALTQGAALLAFSGWMFFLERYTAAPRAVMVLCVAGYYMALACAAFGARAPRRKHELPDGL